MFYILSFALSIICFSLAILNPAFYAPWSSFISEYFVFLSLLFLMPLFVKGSISIPKISLFFILISLIPIAQYSLGQIFYFDKATLSFIYILSFWLAIVIGFNSVSRYKYSLDYYYLVTLSCGLICSLIALAQWFNIEMSVDWVLPARSRPFANMAQPNHLATFLLLSLISCLYFYENKRFNSIALLLFSLLLLSIIGLTQSRTAWVALLYLYLYLSVSYKRDIISLSFKKQSLFLAYFIVSAILLPIFKQSFLKLDTTTVAERASSGYERIQIWQQALDAIKLQPLWGYGWNQSSFAQYETLQFGYAKRYITSFHNIFLDIIVWCGIPIGITVIVVCTFVVIKALLKSVSAIQTCLITSVCVVLIHALLEFPLSYSYFLLPLGFMLGALFFTFNEETIKVNGIYCILVFVFGIVLNLYIVREYSYIPDNMVAAEIHEMNERKNVLSLSYQLNFFDTFESRARWIGLYPCTKLSNSQIEKIRYMVKTYMIHYDLYKFSEVLYFNGHKRDAQKHLNILNYMYEEDVKLSELQCKSH
ncbi:PglL family O-oligosaccharyltransferase [Psychrobacter sp. Pi2-51]|uniref:PglL family O-oligosaccharyltransferase n=1 Tax=Psychrobacter sp. Pi2-51 TaxID=2774132 RepID=UPI0019194D3E|nr:O-antigen ligase family protein [Psychrobacter sp. Pi2-51]